MKIFSLMLFSEQPNSGVITPAAAEQEITSEANTLASESVGTGESIPDAGESTKSKREIYDEFILANKDFFNEDTQKIISLRLKDAKSTKEALDTANGKILDLQAEIERLTPKIQEPQADFLEAHPDFVLQKELENDTFKQLYNSGSSVKSAYYAAHFEELLKSEVANARREAVKATVDTIRAQGMRIKESAAKDGSSLNLKRDVSKLTKAQRADIARRVGAGEGIAFN